MSDKAFNIFQWNANGNKQTKLSIFLELHNVKVADIQNVDDRAILQNDLNSIYDWASGNNMFFNAQKFQYICFNPHTSLSYNVYNSSSL